jgi:hypothetical protein
MNAYLLGVVVLECPIARPMEPDDDSHNLTETQPAFSYAFPGTILQLSFIIFWLEIQTEIINFAEKLYEL